MYRMSSVNKSIKNAQLSITKLQGVIVSHTKFIQSIEKKMLTLFQDINLKRAKGNSVSLQVIKNVLIPRLRKYKEAHTTVLQYIEDNKRMIQKLTGILQRKRPTTAKQGGKKRKSNRTIRNK